MLSHTALRLSSTTYLTSFKTIARHLSSLVLVEHAEGKISSSTLPVFSAAGKLGADITALTVGKDVQSVAEEASRVDGVCKVLVAESPGLQYQLAEPTADIMAQIQERRKYTHLLASSSTFGKNVMPRLAALLGVPQVSDIVDVIDPNTYVRPIYAGNALSTVQYESEGARVITVRATSFPPSELSSSTATDIEVLESREVSVADRWAEKIRWLSADNSTSERPELGSANVVVSGGRPLKSAENFKMIERLADKLGGAVGASRAAVDAGFAPNEWQVGQTGKTIAPDLYIAVGISGAIQHVAGITDSKTIVAINADPDAPIFQVADYGLVGDLFKILPELEKELDSLKN